MLELQTPQQATTPPRLAPVSPPLQAAAETHQKHLLHLSTNLPGEVWIPEDAYPVVVNAPKRFRKVVLQEASLQNVSLQNYLAADSLLFLGCSTISFFTLAASSDQAGVTPLFLLWELVYVFSEWETML